jgi:hypothetical protein
MRITAAMSTLDVDGWIKGLLSAGISGGASAVTGGLVVSGLDPAHYSFNAGKFWILTGSLFMANAIVSVAKFLQGQPLPVSKIVEKTTETTQVGAKPPTVVQTVKETVVSSEPSEAKEKS